MRLLKERELNGKCDEGETELRVRSVSGNEGAIESSP